MSTTWPAPVWSRWRSAIIDRGRRSDAADAVGQPEGRKRRRAVGLPGRVREPAHRLSKGAETRSAGVGAGLSEAGEPHDDQAGVPCVQDVGPDPPALEGARAGSSPRRRPRCAASLRKTAAPSVGLEVEGHGALVAADLLPPQRYTVLAAAVAAHVVAAARVLDLDHVRAEVTQDLAAQRARQDRRDVEDPQSRRGAETPKSLSIRSARRNTRWTVTIAAPPPPWERARTPWANLDH